MEKNIFWILIKFIKVFFLIIKNFIIFNLNYTLRLNLPKSCIFLDNVAENNNVYLDSGKFYIIAFKVYANPISKIISASSITIYLLFKIIKFMIKEYFT